MSDDQAPTELTRREALVGFGVSIGMAACGGSEEEPSTGGELTPPAAPTTAPVPNTPPAATTPPAMPPPDEKLDAKGLLAGIEHIVVLMGEPLFRSLPRRAED